MNILKVDDNFQFDPFYALMESTMYKQNSDSKKGLPLRWLRGIDLWQKEKKPKV
jgi:hypothetical protein